MKKILLMFTLLLVLGAGCDPKELSKPNVKKIRENTSSKIEVLGSAYPNSKILIFVNSDYTSDGIADKEGNFSIPLIFQEEGLKEIKVKQVYKDIESEFSNSQKITVDLSPPIGNIQINSTIPEITKENILKISGTVKDVESRILVNDDFLINLDENGNFTKEIKLREGDNNLKFYLVDRVGNKTGILKEHTVKMDTTAPKLKTGFCFSEYKDLKPTEEYVCIKIGSWQGYLDSVNSVPITGNKKGAIKYITVDGKNIKWDENEEIYHRINLFIYGGLNKYKVVVEDMMGNKTTDYVQTNAERTQDSINLNLNE